ncbi:MAG: S1-like domain-containing RNA-binding protein [Sulfuricurvum sp.]
MQQSKYLVLGKLNTLLIKRDSDFGFFLSSANDKEVLLPNTYKTASMNIGDLIEVFLYTDSEDRLVATTLKPLAMLDEYAIMEVVDSAKFGIFVSWGLPKDLFVPKMYLNEELSVGDRRFFKVIYDEKTHRLVGTPKLGNVFARNPKHLKKFQKVTITPIQKTPLGYKCLVEGRYEGLLYASEIFGGMSIAKEISGYIKQIRSDGLVDLTLRSQNRGDDASKVLDTLKDHNGIMPFNYKSEADAIYAKFSMSKKAFKAALTKLIDSKSITLNDDGISIKKD